MTEINYEGIDVLIRPIIKMLNNNGLKTRFSCQGHGDNDKLYIMFESGTKEDELALLLDLFDRDEDCKLPLGVQVKLYYWIRNTGFEKIGRLSNWMFEVNLRQESDRASTINRMTMLLKEYYEIHSK